MIYTGPGRYNYIQKKKYDLLIMGSSTSTCYYSDLLSKELGIDVLNIGIDGASLMYSRCLLEFVILKNVKPDIIILNIDLFEILVSAWGGNRYSNIEWLLPLYGQSDYIDKALYKGEKLEFLKFIFQSYKYNDLSLSIAKKVLSGNKKYARKKSPNTIMPLQTEEEFQNQPKDKDQFKIDKIKHDLYLDFIRTCKMNDIQLIFIQSPRSWLNNEKEKANYNKINPIFQRMADSNEIPYYVITEDTYPSFASRRYFKDHLHLNDDGSIIFSNIVSKIIQNEFQSILRKYEQ